MSLKDTFKTNTKLAQDGVPVVIARNSDGTDATFNLRRMGDQNKKYAETLAKEYKANQKLLAVGAHKLEEINRKVFCTEVLVGWDHVQPNDGGAKDEIPYSPAAADKLLGDPDWTDLYTRLQNEAASAANFRAEANEAVAKN